MRIKSWLPAVVAPSVIAAGLVIVPLQANAIDLPDLTPAEVLTMAQGANVTAFSGVILKTTELGLPELEFSSMVDQQSIDQMSEKMPEEFADFIPQVLDQNLITQAVELIAGSHTIRVYAADEMMRVQILDPMAQRDLIVGESTVWMHDFDKAIAYKLDFDRAELEAMAVDAEADLLNYLAEAGKTLATPQEITTELLAAVDEGASIEVGIDHRVAGRGAYQLIVTPDAAESTVDYATLSIDAETGIGLQVQVYAKGQEEPAVSIGFESISFATPDASLFEFTAPAGTTIVDANEIAKELEAIEGFDKAALQEKLETAQLEGIDKESLKAEYEAMENAPEILGEGWASVLSVSGMTDQLPMDMLENELFEGLITEVEGGKLFSTPLVNILITDNGRVLAGAVSVDYLISVSR
jgi:outer membrane lipoprotein-sorting protein